MRPLDHHHRSDSPGRSRLPVGLAVAIASALAVGWLIDWPGLVAQEEREKAVAAVLPDPNAVKPIPKRKKEDPEDSAAGAEDPAADDEEKEVVTPQMSRLFPIGRPFEGVRIPSYTGDSLTSVVRSEVMRRIDEQHLDLEQLVITSFAEGENADTRIYMDRAIYDMATEKLTSQSPTRIVQPRFEMEGDRMVFDNKTQLGHMTGNVKMRIFEVDNVFSGGMLSGAGDENENE